MRAKQRIPHHRMLLVTAGTGRVLLDGMPFELQVGSLLFARADSEFEVTLRHGLEYIYISFGGGRGEELIRRFNLNTGRVFDGFEGIIPLWKESLSRSGEEVADLASESMLLYAFSRLRTECGHKDALMSEIIEITEECFRESDFSLSALADRLGYNPKYLSHLFKERMGVNFTEHLRDLRLKYAVMLLDHGIDSVKSVAYLSGFSDPLYFSTVFKRAIGIAPAAYRASVTRAPSGGE